VTGAFTQFLQLYSRVHYKIITQQRNIVDAAIDIYRRIGYHARMVDNRFSLPAAASRDFPNGGPTPPSRVVNFINFA